MKEVTIVSKIVKRGGVETTSSAPSQGGSSISAGNGLNTTYFDRIFVAVDENGNEVQPNDITTPISYILSRYTFASTGGVTFYAKDKSVNVDTIAEALPFDGKTIKYNPDTMVIEVIGGGTGGDAADSIHWDNIEGKPDLATKGDLDGFVKTDGTTVITGLQKFTKGIQGTTGWKISHFDNGNPYFAFNSNLSWLITQYGTEKMEIGNSSAPLTVYKNGNAEIFGDGIVNGNLLVKGGLTFYSTNGAATSFLIDVTSVDKITSTSTTQVYTANSIRLLKNEVMAAKAKAESCESSLKSIKSAITNALNGVSSSSSASKIGQALEELCDILSEL